MKIEIIIKETGEGNIDFQMYANAARQPLTKLEAAYSQIIVQVVKDLVPGITERLGGKGTIDMLRNNSNPTNS